MKNKIIVTGGCGFIGSHLCESLVKNGYDVIAFDRYNISNNYGWLEESKFRKNIEIILGDIRDFDSVNNLMKKAKKCIHLAALIGIPYSYVSPLAYIKTNIEGTYNVLETARNLNYDELIITSTSEIYGTAQFTPMDETHPISPQSPYAASKVAADQIALSYFKSFKLPVKIVRPFNVYGPRQSPRAIIPAIINQFINSKNLNLGNIDTIRDYTYVDDTVSAFLQILRSNKFYGDVVNVGSNHPVKIREIISLVSKFFNKSLKITKDKKRLRPTKSEVLELVCDNSKIKKHLLWKNKIDFKKGLAKTINWNKKNINNFKKNLYHV